MPKKPRATNQLSRIERTLYAMNRRSALFEREMRGFKKEMTVFKDDMFTFRKDMFSFRDDMHSFRDDMLDFKQSTHRSFRQLRQTVDTGFGNLDAKASAAFFGIKEVKDELGTVTAKLGDVHGKMDHFVGTAEANGQEVRALNAALERLEDQDNDDPLPPLD